VVAPQKNDTVRLSLVLSKELDAKLEELAARTNTSKSEVLRRGLGLYDVALEAKGDGLKLGLLDKNRTVVTEIVGI